MTLLLALGVGALIGLSLGALGGGGSILAVPVLVYALGQSPSQATTGSLVVVGATALISAVAAYRAGTVLLTRGIAFGAVAIGGAAAGAKLSTHVSEPLLLAAFVLRVRLISGDTMDVTYEERDASSEGEVVDHVVSTLAEDSGVLRCRHGDRLVVLYARGVAAVEVAPRGAVL